MSKRQADIYLKLVDVLDGTVLDEVAPPFKSIKQAYAWLCKELTWKRGDLRKGPQHHIQAQAHRGDKVLISWILMEHRTVTSVIGSKGRALPGADYETRAKMVWTGIEDQGLARAIAHGTEAPWQ